MEERPKLRTSATHVDSSDKASTGTSKRRAAACRTLATKTCGEKSPEIQKTTGGPLVNQRSTKSSLQSTHIHTEPLPAYLPPWPCAGHEDSSAKTPWRVSICLRSKSAVYAPRRLFDGNEFARHASGTAWFARSIPS